VLRLHDLGSLRGGLREKVGHSLCHVNPEVGDLEKRLKERKERRRRRRRRRRSSAEGYIRCRRKVKNSNMIRAK
jgi:hypothetical protein